jgi:prepilin-type N-terminal cleavage/methylation domain-containing protein
MRTAVSLRRRDQAFTLVELLVVMCIIAVLTGMWMGASSSATGAARRMQARAAAMGLRSAVANYEVEYGKLPLATSGTDAQLETSTGSQLLALLLGENAGKMNPRKQAFIDGLPMAQNGRNGLLGSGDSFGLVDPWGQPYVISLDTNHDQFVANPDRQNQASRIASEALAKLPARVLVYSKGPDQTALTEDDVTTWR